MDSAELYFPLFPTSRTLYDFNRRRPQHFPKQIYSIKDINILSDDAIEHYESFYNSAQNTKISRCLKRFSAGYGLFAVDFILEEAYMYHGILRGKNSYKGGRA